MIYTQLFFFFFSSQRSFRKELFDDACARLERLPWSTLLIEQFRNLAERAHKIAAQNLEKEIDYNDAPEEFRGEELVTMKCS